MKHKRIGVIVVLGLIVSASLYWFLNSLQYKIFRAEGFMDTLWVEDINLYKEHLSTNRVWLLTDNYIMFNFKDDQPRSKEPDITPIMWQGRIEAISGNILSFPLKDIEVVFIESKEGYDIYTEREGDVMDDWMEYADLLGYACISYLNLYDFEGRHEDMLEAFYYLYNFSRLWDGQGFNDTAYTVQGTYAVYKNSMYVYCVKLFDKVLTTVLDLDAIKESTEYRNIQKIMPEVESRLWSAWDPHYGGFHTEYSSGNILGEMNTETTGWVLLAYE